MLILVKSTLNFFKLNIVFHVTISRKYENLISAIDFSDLACAWRFSCKILENDLLSIE